MIVFLIVTLRAIVFMAMVLGIEEVRVGPRPYQIEHHPTWIFWVGFAGWLLSYPLIWTFYGWGAVLWTLLIDTAVLTATGSEG